MGQAARERWQQPAELAAALMGCLSGHGQALGDPAMSSLEKRTPCHGEKGAAASLVRNRDLHTLGSGRNFRGECVYSLVLWAPGMLHLHLTTQSYLKRKAVLNYPVGGGGTPGMLKRSLIESQDTKTAH